MIQAHYDNHGYRDGSCVPVDADEQMVTLTRDVLVDGIIASMQPVTQLPEWMQVHALGQNIRPLAETIADGLLDRGTVGILYIGGKQTYHSDSPRGGV